MLILLVLAFSFFQQVEVVSGGRIAIYDMGFSYFRFLSLLNFWTTASQDVFVYSVSPWNPLSGGQNCEDCNNLRYGCNEYQCHTFGSSCSNITNADTGYELCVWSNPYDQEPPTIQAMESVLKPKYHYEPLNALNPGNGVKIIYKPDNVKGCVPPYTSITLGVNTSEPAECRLSLTRPTGVDQIDYMTEFFAQGTSSVYDHTLVLPSSLTISEDDLIQLGYNVQEGLIHDFYIRCRDTNGNENEQTFQISFCVQPGPDMTSPEIEDIEIDETFYNCQDSVYVESGVTEKDIKIFTNKPITNCSWDFYDTNYEQMNYGMDFCTTQDLNYLQGSSRYGCTGNLKGIDINENNQFYIRCNDTHGNMNKQSCLINLQGTMPLQIDDIRINDLPNESIIRGASDILPVTLKVHTSSGAEEGKARCQYSNDNGLNYYYFYNDGTFEFFTINTQNLNLDATEAGKEYNYLIKCHDKAFNWIESSVKFTLKKDMTPPIVVRAYHESGSLKLITNEYSDCVYSITETTGCNYIFTEGTPISTQDGINHLAPWSSDVPMYVKCKDAFENQPLLPIYNPPCSIILSGSDTYS